ncbi:hypothetical protein Hanom_Chr04g00326601 [Helianthus anomalus]
MSNFVMNTSTVLYRYQPKIHDIVFGFEVSSISVSYMVRTGSGLLTLPYRTRTNLTYTLRYSVLVLAKFRYMYYTRPVRYHYCSNLYTIQKHNQYNKISIITKKEHVI